MPITHLRGAHIAIGILYLLNIEGKGVIFVTIFGSWEAEGMAETEAPQYKGSVGNSKQHHLYRTPFISHGSEILVG